jgi:hypothetical protein
MSTLDGADFNLALLSGGGQHPEPYLSLKDDAQLDDIDVVIHGRVGDSVPPVFAENLFASASSGGQGYRDHDDVFAWQLGDEVMLFSGDIEDANPDDGICDEASVDHILDQLEQTYEDHKHSGQIIFHVEGAPSYFTQFPQCDPTGIWERSVRIGDVANHDHYVGLNPQSLAPIASSVARQTSAVRPPAVSVAKPSWFTTRAYAFAPPQGAFDGYPSPVLNRASVYTSIIHGASGIWYFRWDAANSRGHFMNNPDPTPDACTGSAAAGVRPTMPPSYPEVFPCNSTMGPAAIAQGQSLWTGIAATNAELDSLDSVILSPTVTDSYEVFVSRNGYQSQSPIRTMLKRAGQDYYLFAVNMDNAATEAKFKFGAPIVQAEVLFEGPGGGSRALNMPGNQNTIEEAFSPFAVHIYKFRLNDFDADSTPDNLDDSDLDGCMDAEELGPNEQLGGRRNPNNYWDFYDVPTGPNLQKDKSVSALDTFAVLQRFGAVGTPASPHATPYPSAPAYHPAFDRGPAATPLPGQTPEPWDLTQANGSVAASDYFAVLQQFGHTCAGAPP